MRCFLLAVTLFLLSGCLGNPEFTEDGADFHPGFDISLFNANHEDAFVSSNETISEKISFLSQNNEDFILDCVLDLEVSNQTNSSTKRGKLGVLKPGEIKNVSLTFEMFEGDSSFKVTPYCRQP